MYARLLLLLVVSTIAVLLAEFSLRLLAPIDYLKPAGRQSHPWFTLLHRASPIDGLAYELAPLMQKAAHAGVLVKTNSLGLRDSEPLPPERTDVFRIAALGDSFTFGFGVTGEQAWPNVLERMLQGKRHGHVHEVMNYGVGGYSSRDEALLLKERVIDRKPELIIIAYYLNDPEIDPIQPLSMHFHEPLWWQHSELLRRLARAIYLYRLREHGNDYYRYLHATTGRKWRSVAQAFNSIGETAAAARVPVVLMILPATSLQPWKDYPYRDIHRQVADSARSHGLHVVDVLDAFEHFLPASLMQSASDNHPSRLGHEVIARHLLDWLERNGAKLSY